MLMVDVITHKRDGLELTQEEIEFFVQGLVSGKIPDYQASAFLMAVYWRGLSHREIVWLTDAMVHSGEVIDLSELDGIKVDKHSTGGVGDTTTIVLIPLVGSAGVQIGKMSGRGLGHTGGTIDKLESIPGFRVAYSREEMIKLVKSTGVAIVEQTQNLVPADKLIYALRDVTGTTASIGLIASSVMSKKLASGADRILLDVKAGKGAFLPDWDDTIALTKTMVAIGESFGVKTVAVLSSMDQPLGTRIGNALEIREAIDVLSGKQQGDLLDLCLYLGAELLMLSGRTKDHEEGEKILRDCISSGAAIKKFREMVKAQGGDDRVVDHPDILPAAPVKLPFYSALDGTVQGFDTTKIGQLLIGLGVGRAAREDKVDPSVGVALRKRCGDPVYRGEVIGEVYAQDEKTAHWYGEELLKLITIDNSEPKCLPLILAKIDSEGVHAVA
ncbi:MAG: thymidine phosphorylase [Anaerolineae bacterium]|nr:thymidine phosphorylase [Anaerolineae bacterium]